MLHKKRCIFFLCLIAFSTLFAEGPRRKKLELPGLYYKKAKLIDMYGFTSGEHSAEKAKAEKKK